jgi:nicotinate-nucleotide adenylyltransferase
MIGILGGTFDPVHLGHLRLALEVKEALALREMRLIPAFKPPHRAAPEANPGQRITMLRAAVGKEGDLLVDNRELRREGESFMVDTLRSLREELANEAICLVLGTDAFLKLDQWHEWQHILELAHIVVVHRPGSALDIESASEDMQALWRRHQVTDSAALQENIAGGILLQAVTPLEISSTDIRALVTAGHNPRYLVSDAVWNLIRMQGLYGVNASQQTATDNNMSPAPKRRILRTIE